MRLTTLVVFMVVWQGTHVALILILGLFTVSNSTLLPESLRKFKMSDLERGPMDLADFSFETKRFEEFSPHLLYDMLRLRSDVFVVEQTCVFLDLDDEDQLCLHSVVMHKAKPDKVVACLRIFPPEQDKEGSMTRIGRVVTSKEFRGKGIAKKLMVDAMEYSRTEYPDCPIKVGAQAHLDAFYGKGTETKPGLGFRRISEVYDEDGIDHVDMVYP